MQQESTAICILGMHRSGTSAVARAVALLGAYLGEESELMRPALFNPEGFWEHKRIVELQQRMLEALGRSWDTRTPLPVGWQRSPEVDALKRELQSFIAQQFASVPLWGWKDPRTCLLLPLWKTMLAELGIKLKCIFVIRNPLDVAESLLNRDGFDAMRSLAIWQAYTLSALAESSGLPRVVVSYDRLLDGWEPELARVAEALELSWPPGEAQAAELNRFLSPKLRHSRTELAQLEQAAPALVSQLYREALEASSLRGSLEASPFQERLAARLDELRAHAALFRIGDEQRRDGATARLLQVFWRDGLEPFAAERSHTRLAALHGITHTYAVPLPAMDEPCSIRIDPVNFAAVFKLEAIEWRDASGRCLLRLSETSDLARLTLNGCHPLPSESALRFVALSEDPQLILDVPASPDGPGTLSVTMTILESLNEEWTGTLEERLRLSDDRLAEATAELREARRQLEALALSLRKSRFPGAFRLRSAGAWLGRAARRLGLRRS